jgi:hypothetical protein
MPTLQLSDTELAEAAQCARVGQQQALKDAAAQGSSSMRRIFEEEAARRGRLGEKFEAARLSLQTHQKSRLPR